MTARIVDGVLQSPFTLSDFEDISVPQLIRDRLQRYADKVVAIDVDAHLTGAELLHRIRRCAAGFSRDGLKRGTRVCCQLGNALDAIVAAMGIVFAGGTLVMAKAAFVERELRYQIEDSNCEWILTDQSNSSKALQVMEKIPLKITTLVGVPVKMQMFINEAKSSGRKLPHVDKIVFGGSTVSSSMARDICDMMTPSTLANLYGMTETFGLVSTTKVGEFTVDNMGLPCAGCEVKVVDVNSGKLLEPFEQGELCVRSPNVMKGYHRRPEATAEVLDSDGWLRTGDLGYYDREGHLYMVERLKQLIKCMDSQLAPSELEEILLTHDAVAEVAVVGVPSAKYGEAPAACVVLNASYDEPHNKIEEELKKLVAGQTAVYKYLYGGVIFLESLPKAENGKVLKKQLLAKFADKPIV
ncbi:uncharacterized protein LOC119442195 isoform X2 [Dermacentor silvarum]|uniref:uncharacterized protein LOC119442195 isoform X2 n=1 Tax=Dermacentor silvarum TaxID=543639 RepID=UPI00189812AC|nr:uncharacterized protein LOC119442195 isoform X2 [Dermacentor silvarum]